METKAIIEKAVEVGNYHADKVDDKGSNGSEAFQYVSLKTKGNRKLQNDLKKMGIKKDAYYGYLITPIDFDQRLGYWKGETWCQIVAEQLTENGIPAYAGDRLL